MLVAVIQEPQYLTLLSALDDVNIYVASNAKKVLGAPTNSVFCLRVRQCHLSLSLSLSLFAFFRFCEDPDSQRIRSAGRNLLHVPCHRLSTYGRRRAFAIAGPSVWNSLPDPVRNPNSTETALRHLSKEIFVGTVVAHLAHQGPSPVMRYRN